LPRVASARRYAEAIFQIAREQDKLEEWRTSLREVVEVLQQVLWQQVLQSCRIPLESKHKLLSQGFPEKDPLVLNLVSVLVSRGRLGLFPQIVAEYERLLDRYSGIEHAQVVTAVSLEKEDQQRLAEVLSIFSGHEVIVDTEVDSSIVGGLVVRLEDKVIDGSVKGRLSELKKKLVRTTL
jgi:F-type H+-transporting ATPase subunit delta